ncbi:hypothetical protein GGX14DRAFT_480334 [Mycena pura]|uniref:F-box domain-containing protein n=1 Tax=Mycena pura TaxID=153505 RepID=A0AAD6Y346_9AGAR|nr:hypothetical protein GGX14DRAFT_480334 [Mycena pura]
MTDSLRREPVPGELSVHRDALQAQLDPIVFSINSLPFEILAEIFLCARHECRHKTPSGKRPPLLLLRVCRYWRDVAVSTPSLWTRLSVILRRKETPGQSALLDAFLARWTNRAGTAPLSLRLYDTSLLAPRDRIDALLQLYAPRTTFLRVQTSASNLMGLPSLDSLTHLERLTLTTRLTTAAWHDVHAFCQAPALRGVVLEMGAIPSFIRIPWHQLTTFTGSGFSVAEALYVLRECSQLTKCTLPHLDLRSWHGVRLRDLTIPFTHTALRELSISNTAAAVLPCLVLLELRDLTLRQPVELPAPAVTIPAFLAGSLAHSLRRLAYIHSSDAASTVAFAAKWLAPLTNLEELSLKHIPIPFLRSFIRALNHTSTADNADVGGPTFLPWLRTLELELEPATRSSGRYEIDGELVDALYSRSYDIYDSDYGFEDFMVAPLESFRLVSSTVRLHEDLIAEFYGLVDEGMKIHIGSADANILE